MLHQINEGSDIISDKWWINESVEYVGFDTNFVELIIFDEIFKLKESLHLFIYLPIKRFIIQESKLIKINFFKN